MVDYAAYIYVIVALVGIVYGAYSGYREARKEDPTVEFNVEMFVLSLLRALPGIFSASVLAIVGINFSTPEQTFQTIEGIIAAFFTGVGSDVVLKRTWRSAKG